MKEAGEPVDIKWCKRCKNFELKWEPGKACEFCKAYGDERKNITHCHAFMDKEEYYGRNRKGVKKSMLRCSECQNFEFRWFLGRVTPWCCANDCDRDTIKYCMRFKPRKDSFKQWHVVEFEGNWAVVRNVAGGVEKLTIATVGYPPKHVNSYFRSKEAAEIVAAALEGEI